MDIHHLNARILVPTPSSNIGMHLKGLFRYARTIISLTVFIVESFGLLMSIDNVPSCSSGPYNQMFPP